jgi:hypothetical protein
MWPRAGFKRCERRASESDTAGEYWRVRGHDVAAVAFVDRAPEHRRWAPSAFHELGSERPLGHALDLLAQSGTPEPFVACGGARPFLAWLRSREYRGAAVISEPTVHLDRDGRPLRVTLRTLAERAGVGYVPRLVQPLAIGDDAAEIAPRRVLTHGVGAASDRTRLLVDFGDDGVSITHWQRFSLASGADLFGRFPGGNQAPQAWIKLVYRLAVDGHAEAYLASSYLPSCWFYVDYQRVFRHDMLSISTPELQRFLFPDRDVPWGTTWARVDASSGCVHAAV